MPAAAYPALFFTVALLVTTAYFLLGGLPLLVLKHDTPLDSGFVRSFFNVYYFAAIVTAAGTSISYAFFGRLDFAIGRCLCSASAQGPTRRPIASAVGLPSRHDHTRRKARP